MNSDLPELVIEITEEFDLKTALEFASEFGGQRIYIPITDNTKLKDRINSELLSFLIMRFGGTFLDIPAYQRGSLRERRILMDKLIAEGKSLNEITKATGACLSSVVKRRRKIREEETPPLLKIFDE